MYTVVVAVPPIAADDDAAWSELDLLIASEGPVPQVFEDFLKRITVRYPCLTELRDDQLNQGVWSDAPLRKKLGHRASVFSISRRAKQVARFMIEEANALGLCVLNRAAHTIHRPDAELGDAGLAFFNELSGTLRIQLSEPTERVVEELENQKATPSAVIVSLHLDATIHENDDFRELTDEELERVALAQTEVALGSHGRAIRHAAPNGVHFTVRELLAAVEETERQTRGASDWFDGVDVHHVFFEGIQLGDDGVWAIRWGS
jgi:hypothetical protein